MHELSLAENVLQIIEEAAVEQGFRRVKTVVLEIGSLAAVEPDAMAFCFDAAMRGSCAEDAELRIVSAPGIGRCADCATEFGLEELPAACPSCGGYRVEPIAGMALRVSELEVE